MKQASRTAGAGPGGAVRMSRYITCDEIREMIDADSLAYLSLEALRAPGKSQS